MFVFDVGSPRTCIYMDAFSAGHSHNKFGCNFTSKARGGSSALQQRVLPHARNEHCDTAVRSFSAMCISFHSVTSAAACLPFGWRTPPPAGITHMQQASNDDVETLNLDDTCAELPHIAKPHRLPGKSNDVEHEPGHCLGVSVPCAPTRHATRVRQSPLKKTTVSHARARATLRINALARREGMRRRTSEHQVIGYMYTFLRRGFDPQTNALRALRCSGHPKTRCWKARSHARAAQRTRTHNSEKTRQEGQRQEEPSCRTATWLTRRQA